MSKKKGGGKKGGGNKLERTAGGVRIAGIQGRVNLRRDILKPLRQSLQSARPDFSNKDFRRISNIFDKAGADGRISRKELGKIQERIANTSGHSGFTFSEGQLAKGAIPNAINARQYERYTDRAQKDFQSFRKGQERTISNMMKTQRQAMKSQLNQIQSGAKSSLNNYKSTLNKSTAASQQMLQGQRDTFAQGNAQSMQNVRKYQSQIKALPGMEQHLTQQISSSVTPVNSGDPFLNIGLQQAAQNIRPGQVDYEEFSPVQGMAAFSPVSVDRTPVGVKRDPTIMGLSGAQKASSARQQQGIQGFRTKQVA